MERLSILMDKYIRKDANGLDEKARKDCLALQRFVQECFLQFLGPCVGEASMVSEDYFKDELRGFVREYGEKYPQIKEFVKLD